MTNTTLSELNLYGDEEIRKERNRKEGKKKKKKNEQQTEQEIKE